MEKGMALNTNQIALNTQKQVEAGRYMNRIGIGKYNGKCNIDKCKKEDLNLFNI